MQILISASNGIISRENLQGSPLPPSRRTFHLLILMKSDANLFLVLQILLNRRPVISWRLDATSELHLAKFSIEFYSECANKLPTKVMHKVPTSSR